MTQQLQRLWVICCSICTYAGITSSNSTEGRNHLANSVCICILHKRLPERDYTYVHLQQMPMGCCLQKPDLLNTSQLIVAWPACRQQSFSHTKQLLHRAISVQTFPALPIVVPVNESVYWHTITFFISRLTSFTPPADDVLPPASSTAQYNGW